MRLPQLSRGLIAKVSADLTAKNKDMSRALPSSKGGETPKQLQTYRTDIYTYFTEVGGSRLLYSAENWVRIKLKLKTAGPVAIGTSAEITPVLSGHGILLDTNVDYEAYLAKGTRVFIASESVNRVNITIEPVPWLEQLDNDTIASQDGVKAAVMSIGSAIVAAVNAIRGGKPIESSTGRQAEQTPTPSPAAARLLAPGLTRRGALGRLR